MEFRLLGPLEVSEHGHPISLGGSRARALLAILLLHRNEVVSVERIVDELWGERPPKTADQVVRVYVSQLRKALEPNRSDEPPQVLVTRGPGYLLRIDPDQLDIDQFDALRTEGRRLIDSGDAARAAEVFDRALSLWRGTPLQDFAYEAFAQPEIARLGELRLATLEDRFDAELAAGRDSELVADLEQLVGANPLRERLQAQLMLALYRSGRQADALDTYRRARRLLVDELGLDPSEALRQLEARILQQDRELDRPSQSPHLHVTEPQPVRRSRRSAVLGIVSTALAVSAIAGILIAATTGNGPHRRNVASFRIALVESGHPNPTNADPVGVDPITGLREAATQLGFHPRVLYGGDTKSSFLHKVAFAARQNYDLVIVGATPYLEALSELTRRFSKQRFLVPDSVSDPRASFAGQRNVTGLNFHDREDGYLGGYLAALMTHGHEAVSAVGGKQTQSVLNLIAGFKAGAQRARPGIRVLVGYSRTFFVQSRCERLADRQIRLGSAVVFDVAGYCGFGALAAAQDRNVWGLGVDDDLSYLGPQILASVVKRLANATQIAITDFVSGQLPRGQDLQFDFSNNAIGVVGISSQVPAAVLAKFALVEAKLREQDQARDTH